MGGQGVVLTDKELADIARKQEIVSKLNTSGAFDVRGGSVTLHFDGDGLLRKVDRSDTLLRI